MSVLYQLSAGALVPELHVSEGVSVREGEIIISYVSLDVHI